MTTLILQHKVSRFPVIQKFIAGVEAANAWLQRHHQRKQLTQLDERLLRDIGVDAEQVKAEVSKPFWK